MRSDELWAAGDELLVRARAVRAAFADPVGRAAVDLGSRPVTPAGVNGNTDGWQALVYLWQEAVLVRAGGAESTAVLDDEVANVERVLAVG